MTITEDDLQKIAYEAQEKTHVHRLKTAKRVFTAHVFFINIILLYSPQIPFWKISTFILAYSLFYAITVLAVIDLVIIFWDLSKKRKTTYLLLIGSTRTTAPHFTYHPSHSLLEKEREITSSSRDDG